MHANRNLKGVVWFLLSTFVLTWGLWSVLWFPALRGTPGVAAAALTLGMWVPGICALLVTRLVLGESLRTTTIDRLGTKRYYLWAWFLPIAGTLAAAGLTVAFGIAQVDPHFSVLRKAIETSGASLPIPLWAVVLAQFLAAVTIAPLINVLFAVGEEIGWRGFLLPRLMQAGLGQWPALLLSGAIWGLWHAPAIANGHNYPTHPYLGILLTTVFAMLLGIIFGWLQLRSGSVWVPSIAHGSLNAIAGLPLILLTPFDTAVGGTLTSVVGWIPMVAFIAWLCWTRRLPVPLGQPAATPDGNGRA